MCRGEATQKAMGIPKGDLWELFAQFVSAKGHSSIRISKVKGHATDDMVREGQVLQQHKDGNDKAEQVAKKGIQKHGEEFVKIAGWYASRHLRYITFLKDIHNHLIEGSVIGKGILTEREKQQTESKSGTHPGGSQERR